VNGESYQAEAFINKGDAEDPYSTEEIREKYFGLLEPLYGNELTEKLHTRLMRFETVDNINTVTDLVAG
jgi:hypothetical protein